MPAPNRWTTTLPAEPSIHFTVKFEVPKRLLSDVDLAQAHASLIAGEEAERAVREFLTNQHE